MVRVLLVDGPHEEMGLRSHLHRCRTRWVSRSHGGCDGYGGWNQHRGEENSSYESWMCLWQQWWRFFVVDDKEEDAKSSMRTQEHTAPTTAALGRLRNPPRRLGITVILVSQSRRGPNDAGVGERNRHNNFISSFWLHVVLHKIWLVVR
jgi:hypothetical protein